MPAGATRADHKRRGRRVKHGDVRWHALDAFVTGPSRLVPAGACRVNRRATAGPTKKVARLSLRAAGTMFALRFAGDFAAGFDVGLIVRFDAGLASCAEAGFGDAFDAGLRLASTRASLESASLSGALSMPAWFASTPASLRRRRLRQRFRHRLTTRFNALGFPRGRHFDDASDTGRPASTRASLPCAGFAFGCPGLALRRPPAPRDRRAAAPVEQQRRASSARRPAFRNNRRAKPCAWAARTRTPHPPDERRTVHVIHTQEQRPARHETEHHAVEPHRRAAEEARDRDVPSGAS